MSAGTILNSTCHMDVEKKFLSSSNAPSPLDIWAAGPEYVFRAAANESRVGLTPAFSNAYLSAYTIVQSGPAKSELRSSPSTVSKLTSPDGTPMSLLPSKTGK